MLWYTAQLREMQAASADEISRSKRLREVADSRVRELQVSAPFEAVLPTVRVQKSTYRTYPVISVLICDASLRLCAQMQQALQAVNL